MPKPSTKFIYSLLYFHTEPGPRTRLQTSGAPSKAIINSGVRDRPPRPIPGVAYPNHPSLLGPTASSRTQTGPGPNKALKRRPQREPKPLFTAGPRPGFPCIGLRPRGLAPPAGSGPTMAPSVRTRTQSLETGNEVPEETHPPADRRTD